MAYPLYMVSYDHSGIVGWGLDFYTKWLRNAVEWLDRYPSFKIGLDNDAYTYDYLADKAPGVLRELRRDLAAYPGRLGVGTCTYGQPLSAFINEESNIRQIAYAIEADREHLGVRPTVYAMSEHAIHSQHPQILAGLGFTAAILRTPFMSWGYCPEFDVPIGSWVGLDGSRLPAVPAYKGEGAEFGWNTEDCRILTRYPNQERESPATFKARFARLKPTLAYRADDCVWRQEGLVREYEGKSGFKWILLEEILPSFPPALKDMPTTPDDFKARMPWGYCGNEMWNSARRAEVAVLTAERLAAMELLLGGANREEDLHHAWKSLLVGQHHDIQVCGLLEDGRRFLGDSLESSGRVSRASMEFVAGHMRGGSAGQITVFNPHSWPRREWIEVQSPHSGRGTVAVTHDDGPVASAPLAAGEAGTRLALLAEVPALGFTSYALGPGAEAARPSIPVIEVDQKALTLTNQAWRVRLHPEGGIAAIQDRRTGAAMLKPASRPGCLAGRIEGVDCQSHGKWTIPSAAEGAPWVTARDQGTISGIPYTLDLTVHAETPRLDFRISCHFDRQRIGAVNEIQRDWVSIHIHEAKLRFRLLPAIAASAVGVRDVPFGVAETGEPYVQGIYWTAISDGEVGMAVFNRGTMCSVREMPAYSLPVREAGAFSIPLAYSGDYSEDSVRGRRLRGDFSYDFALYPFTGPWKRADLHRHALEYSFPLVSLVSAAGDGRLGHEVKLLEAPSANVVISALYTESGKARARFYEYQGRHDRLALRYLRGQARLTEIDLAGNERKSNVSSLAFRPWQFRTVLIYPPAPGGHVISSA